LQKPEPGSPPGLENLLSWVARVRIQLTSPLSFALSLLGRFLTVLFIVGTQRRVMKKSNHATQSVINENKQLKAAIKKFGK